MGYTPSLTWVGFHPLHNLTNPGFWTLHRVFCLATPTRNRWNKWALSDPNLLGSYYGIIQGQDPWSRSLVLATMIPEEKMRMALLLAYDSSIPMIFIKKRTSKSPKSNGYSHSRNDPSTKFWDFFTIPVEHTPDPQPIVYDGISLEGEFLAYVPFYVGVFLWNSLVVPWCERQQSEMTCFFINLCLFKAIFYFLPC